MKAITGILAGLLILAPAMVAEENTQLTTWMKACGQSFGGLMKMETKTGKEAIHYAERMGGIYEEMIGFWRQRNAGAAKYAEEGKAALGILAAAAYSGDAAKASEAAATLGTTCKNCHTERRIKLENGKFAIKP